MKEREILVANGVWFFLTLVMIAMTIACVNALMHASNAREGALAFVCTCLAIAAVHVLRFWRQRAIKLIDREWGTR